jgi:hypothetical protein
MTGGVHLSVGHEERVKAARLEASSCGEVAIRQGATGVRASWAGREAEAQWEEGERAVGKEKKEWAAAGPKGRMG